MARRDGPEGEWKTDLAQTADQKKAPVGFPTGALQISLLGAREGQVFLIGLLIR